MLAIEYDLEKFIPEIMADPRTTLFPMVSHTASIRDFNYLRELFDGRNAVRAHLETKTLIMSPLYKKLFGTNYTLWLCRTILVDIAAKKNGQLEILPESIEDNLKCGFNHYFRNERAKQGVAINFDRKANEVELSKHLESIFSYADQLNLINQIGDIRSLLSERMIEYINEKTQTESV